MQLPCKYLQSTPAHDLHLSQKIVLSQWEPLQHVRTVILGDNNVCAPLRPRETQGLVNICYLLHRRFHMYGTGSCMTGQAQLLHGSDMHAPHLAGYL